MHIIFFSRRCWPHDGGVESHVAHTLRALRGKHKITVVTERHDPALPETEEWEGATIRRIPLPQERTQKSALWKWIWQHRAELATADVWHVHDVFFWVLPFLGWWWRKPVFLTQHGYEGTVPTWRQVLWHQVGWLLADGTIGVGGFHERWYGVKPDVVTFGGVLAQRTRAHSANLKNAVVFAGRLAEDTGILEYLEACSLLPARERCHIDVYGDGPLRSNLSALVKEHKLPVTFYGWVPATKIPWSSYRGALGSGYLALLSAFAAELPVLAVAATPIKYDYWTKTPFAAWLTVVRDRDGAAAWLAAFRPLATAARPRTFHHTLPQRVAAKRWAHSQTWRTIAAYYEDLWSHTTKDTSQADYTPDHSRDRHRYRA